ncbi:hypothetical protein JTB14_009303 [Gonioctena quinquepunctata]|nr:hypothetical protein JTB14_009303 [Gonioctena quinquepunctata]
MREKNRTLMLARGLGKIGGGSRMDKNADPRTLGKRLKCEHRCTELPTQVPRALFWERTKRFESRNRGMQILQSDRTVAHTLLTPQMDPQKADATLKMGNPRPH